MSVIFMKASLLVRVGHRLYRGTAFILEFGGVVKQPFRTPDPDIGSREKEKGVDCLLTPVIYYIQAVVGETHNLKSQPDRVGRGVKQMGNMHSSGFT
jgi:hypothetical protein